MVQDTLADGEPAEFASSAGVGARRHVPTDTFLVSVVRLAEVGVGGPIAVLQHRDDLVPGIDPRRPCDTARGVGEAESGKVPVPAVLALGGRDPHAPDVGLDAVFAWPRRSVRCSGIWGQVILRGML